MNTPIKLFPRHLSKRALKLQGTLPFFVRGFRVFRGWDLLNNSENIILETIYCRFWLTAEVKIRERIFSGGQGWEGSLPVRNSNQLVWEHTSGGPRRDHGLWTKAIVVGFFASDRSLVGKNWEDCWRGWRKNLTIRLCLNIVEDASL